MALVLVVLLAWRITGVFMYHTWVRWVWRVLISPYMLAGGLIAIVAVIFTVLCLGRIRYSIDASVSSESTARVEVSYFLKLVHFVLDYQDGKLSNRVRIAWIWLGQKKSRRRKRRKNAKNPPQNTQAAKASETTTTEMTAKSSATTTKPITKPSDASTTEPTAKPDTTKKPPTKPDETSNATHEQEDEQEEKDRKSPLTPIKEIWTYPDRKLITSLCIRCLQKFIKALKPRHLDIAGVVGFEDPCTTGWAMGAYEAIVGTLGLRHKVRILGSYIEKALELRIELNGRTRVWGLLWPFIWLYLQKPIRTVIHKHLF